MILRNRSVLSQRSNDWRNQTAVSPASHWHSLLIHWWNSRCVLCSLVWITCWFNEEGDYDSSSELCNNILITMLVFHGVSSWLLVVQQTFVGWTLLILLVEIHLFAGWNSLCLNCLFVCLLECLLAELHTIVDHSIHVERCFGKLLICLGELSDFGGFHGCFPRSFWSLSCFPPIEALPPGSMRLGGPGVEETTIYYTHVEVVPLPCEPLKYQKVARWLQVQS